MVLAGGNESRGYYVLPRQGPRLSEFSAWGKKKKRVHRGRDQRRRIGDRLFASVAACGRGTLWKRGKTGHDGREKVGGPQQRYLLGGEW